jgi:CBS domain-containing protein
MESIQVADVMTRNPIIIDPETNLLECAKQMVKNRTGSLVLVEDNILKGFISEHDILWALVKKSKDDLANIKAIDISPRKIAVIKPSATLRQAFEKMKNLKFERLPVVKEKEFLGLITIKDILNFNPEFYPELEELSQIREETEKLKRIKKVRTSMPVREGLCEECGNTELLYHSRGMLICGSCRDD